MTFLRNLDLYKAIVLLSLVLLPVGGWLVKKQDDDIAACRKAIDDAAKAGGWIEKIGRLQRNVEIVVANKRNMSDAIKNPGVYFQDQILAAGGGSVRTVDFEPMTPKQENVTMKGTKQAVTDHIVEIKWLRKDPLPYDFVQAVIFNCESGARAASGEAQQSAWKLRELMIENMTSEQLLRANKTPPQQLDDKWNIGKLSFVRREPKGT